MGRVFFSVQPERGCRRGPGAGHHGLSGEKPGAQQRDPRHAARGPALLPPLRSALCGHRASFLPPPELQPLPDSCLETLRGSPSAQERPSLPSPQTHRGTFVDARMPDRCPATPHGGRTDHGRGGGKSSALKLWGGLWEWGGAPPLFPRRQSCPFSGSAIRPPGSGRAKMATTHVSPTMHQAEYLAPPKGRGSSEEKYSESRGSSEKTHKRGPAGQGGKPLTVLPTTALSAAGSAEKQNKEPGVRHVFLRRKKSGRQAGCQWKSVTLGNSLSQGRRGEAAHGTPFPSEISQEGRDRLKPICPEPLGQHFVASSARLWGSSLAVSDPAGQSHVRQVCLGWHRCGSRGEGGKQKEGLDGFTVHPACPETARAALTLPSDWAPHTQPVCVGGAYHCSGCRGWGCPEHTTVCDPSVVPDVTLVQWRS